MPRGRHAGAQFNRHYPVGAEVVPGGGVSFRVWAPRRQKVEVVSGDDAHELKREESGYFSGVAAALGDGALYRFRLDGGDAFPDPVSRFQPEGPHGPSRVVDPGRFAWTDREWRGVGLNGQVVYELHVGTFTPEGTWAAATRELPELAETGITVIELMPVADFSGRFGWGYDGVGLFAPVAIYGEPDDFRRFVDEAHRLGVGVILDVVYNHLGPDGNYLKQFSEDYFTDRYKNEWGEAVNFDGENAGPVREWVVTNAAYWAEEYHIDGLRLDATQQIFDASKENIMTALAKKIRQAASPRQVVVIAENEPQQSELVRPVDQGGLGLDGLWNDDFHHSARVALTGRSEAYYSDYRGRPQEFIAAAKFGYLYQGQFYTWQAKNRGTPSWGVEPAQFVNYIQNHDQVANSGRGDRVHRVTSAGRYRAITALLLLSPGTPMLFQGQEFASSSPFLYFADHCDSLRQPVREGRLQFLSQFPSLAQTATRRCLADPCDLGTFEACKLDFSERKSHREIYQLHKDLLRLRREDPVFHAQKRGGVDGSVLDDEAFVLRYFGGRDGDRLLFVNFGPDLMLAPIPEPLLAPPAGKVWTMSWSSEDPAYGGCGAAPPEGGTGWVLTGHSAAVFTPADPKNTWQI